MATPVPSETTGRGRTPVRIDGWLLATVVIAALVALPVMVVGSYVLHPTGEVWRHLAATVLGGYVANSVTLMLGVGVAVLLIGVSTAWLTTACRFPGASWLQWALLLPLAMPAYISAYAYAGMLDFAGPVQSALREWFGWSRDDYWFPEVRSLGGATLMLSLVSYPYVYLMCRSAFLERSAGAIDAGRIFGCGPWQSFFRVSLPAARPAIAAGLTLALMETLADYGTVQHFGVSTFTTGIFRTWFGLGDSAAAAQLSALMMLFVLMLIVGEQWSRGRARFHHVGSRSRPPQMHVLSGARAWLAFVACAVPVLLGFVVPGVQLASWAAESVHQTLDERFLTLVTHTLELAAFSAVLATLLALVLSYGKRLRPSPPVVSSVKVASLGYAIPGTVVAVGVMLPFAAVDNALDAWARATVGVSTGLLLSGTLFALVFAYMTRFIALSLQSVDTSLAKITPAMDDAGRSLGHRPVAVLRNVHLPMLRGSLLTAALLVFVDVMKELPATLVLRPFNFNTLAVRTYELASDERLEEAALSALAIVLAGLAPVILLSVSIARSRASPARRRRRPAPTLADIPEGP